MIRKLKKLWRLSWPDRLLLIEATLALARAGLALRLVPFRRIAPGLGETMASSPEQDPIDAAELGRIGWAVAASSKSLPWESLCLAEAVAGKWMLQRRGLRSTLYLGLAREGQSEVEAHAWLRCGGVVLTGGGARQRYSVIASFAEPPAEGEGASRRRPAGRSPAR